MNDDRVFLDNNILIYAYSRSDLEKRQKSRRALLFYDSVISTQVISEFCNVCIKKLHYPVSEIRVALADILAACSLFHVDDETIQHALTIQERYGFSYFDSQILAAAIEAHCSSVFTEDLQDGQIVESVTIRNLFTL
jgi:predicted nucleic acid-binding protein